MAATDISEALKAGGHRVTAPRQAVWTALVAAGSHLTADELSDQVRRSDRTINVASVYRSLTLFEELGLVRQSRLGPDAASTWEVAHPDEHFHLVCTACGSIDHHRGSLVESVRSHLSGDHGFRADHIELTVSGVCAACAGVLPA